MYIVQELMSLYYLREKPSVDRTTWTTDPEQAQTYITVHAAAMAAKRADELAVQAGDEARFIVRPFQPFAALYA